jgi:hypothetical protein
MEFKPLLQYNASTPPLPSPSFTTFNFSSPDLRKSFLSSSSSALLKSQSPFGDIVNSPNTPQKNFKKEENLMKDVLKKEEHLKQEELKKEEHPKQEVTSNKEELKKDEPLKKDRREILKKQSAKKQVLMSPLRPSFFSVAGEKDESYAVGANYITFVCPSPSPFSSPRVEFSLIPFSLRLAALQMCIPGFSIGKGQ